MASKTGPIEGCVALAVGIRCGGDDHSGVGHVMQQRVNDGHQCHGGGLDEHHRQQQHHSVPVAFAPEASHHVGNISPLPSGGVT